MDGQSRLTIGDLARMTGTKVVTVRYYEQIGLLPAPSRTSGNYRAYDSEHLYRLRFIRRCRDLGFILDQVRALLRLSSQENHACDQGLRMKSLRKPSSLPGACSRRKKGMIFRALVMDSGC